MDDAEAFTVQCGLGAAMTPMNILDDQLILTARLRTAPGEHRDLTFAQAMAAGG